jgi:putative nucleotidyltransferase with HDIG domain
MLITVLGQVVAGLSRAHLFFMRVSRVRVRLGIRYQLAVFAVLLVAATAVATGAVSVRRERQILELQVLSKGRMITEAFAADCAGALSPRRDEHKLTAAIRGMLSDESVGYAFVVDGENRIVAHSDLSMWGEDYTPPTENVRHLLDDSLTYIYRSADGRKFYGFSAPIVVSKRELGTAHVGISVRLVSEPLGMTRKRLITATLVLLALGAVTASMIGGLLTRPLAVLADGAKRIGDGDLSYRIELNRGDEFGLLAQRINGMTSKLGELYFRTLQTLINALEAKDIYGRGHTERVTRYSIQIARKMGLQLSEVENVRRAAMIHDIGKIGVKEAILNKATGLTEEEYNHVKSHVNWGAHILKPMRSLARVVSYLSHHHERYDGSGYPAGLSSREIPIGSRIIAVADTFDAMTSDRPYRRALTTREAITELKRCSGSQFDPEVVQTFIEVLKSSKMNGLESITSTE